MLDPYLLEMVAFDIETEGLDPSTCSITAASLFNGKGLCRGFVFKGECLAEDERAKEEFLSHLDNARSLCAFNGVCFDIPFIAKAWSLDPGRVHNWVVKTFDVFETCRLGLGKTFSLDKLLAANGLESKTGSGKRAIQLAQEKEWDKLNAYCMQDTRLTYLVSAQRAVVLPIKCNGGVMVLDHAHPSLFVVW